MISLRTARRAGVSARAAVHLLQLIGPWPASWAAAPPPRAMSTRAEVGNERACAGPAPDADWKAFLAERDWRAVSAFWAARLVGDSVQLPMRDAGSDPSHWVTSGSEWLSSPGFSKSHWRQDRTTFLAEIAYVGECLSGLQRHPGQRTVIGCLEATLAPVLASDEKTSGRIPGLAAAGRTDAAVSAYGQVLSFHTWRNVDAGEIAAAINRAAPGEIKALRVSPVPRAFHANFAATWRRYLYLFPLERQPGQAGRPQTEPTGLPRGSHYAGERDDSEEDRTVFDVDVERVNRQLQQLRGRPLHFNALAYKEIKKLHSSTDADVCMLHEARAFHVTLPAGGEDEVATRPDGSTSPCVIALAVELKADRFLRRMVRILVSTAVREAKLNRPDDALLHIILAGDRSLAAPAAPGLGLCFVGAGYEPYDQSHGGAAIRHLGAPRTEEFGESTRAS